MLVFVMTIVVASSIGVRLSRHLHNPVVNAGTSALFTALAYLGIARVSQGQLDALWLIALVIVFGVAFASAYTAQAVYSSRRDSRTRKDRPL